MGEQHWADVTQEEMSNERFLVVKSREETSEET
jgi:hypothetical protein